VRLVDGTDTREIASPMNDIPIKQRPRTRDLHMTTNGPTCSRGARYWRARPPSPLPQPSPPSPPGRRRQRRGDSTRLSSFVVLSACPTFLRSETGALLLLQLVAEAPGAAQHRLSTMDPGSYPVYIKQEYSTD